MHDRIISDALTSEGASAFLARRDKDTIVPRRRRSRRTIGIPRAVDTVGSAPAEEGGRKVRLGTKALVVGLAPIVSTAAEGTPLRQILSALRPFARGGSEPPPLPLRRPLMPSCMRRSARRSIPGIAASRSRILSSIRPVARLPIATGARGA